MFADQKKQKKSPCEKYEINLLSTKYIVIPLAYSYVPNKRGSY